MALGRRKGRQTDPMVGCAPYHAGRQGRPSIPPGRHFRLHPVGHLEGIDGERGLEWRWSDSLSLRELLRLGATEPAPGHSWLGRTRAWLPLEHRAVALAVVAAHDRPQGG